MTELFIGLSLGLIIGFGLNYLYSKWMTKRLLTTWTVTCNQVATSPMKVDIISHTDEELIKMENEEKDK